MTRSKSKKTCAALIFCLLLLLLQPMQVLSAEVGTERLAGTDRYETAVSISRAGWTAAENVILAGGADANLVDALTAAPLAKLLNAPILLTESGRLTPVTAAEIQRLGAKNIYLAGGDGVITPPVQEAARALGAATVPLGGADRFATAANIAAEIAQRTTVSTVVIVTAYSSADALSIASVAAANGWPVLLTGVEALPDSAAAFISAHNVSAVYAVGGAGVISTGLLASLPGAVRLGGATRYETNLAVLKQFEDSWDYSKGLFVANGANNHLVDALTAAAYIAGAPLFLTDNGALPEAAKTFLAEKAFTRVVGLGGAAVTSAAVLQNLVSAVGAAAVVPPVTSGGGGGGGRAPVRYVETDGALTVTRDGAYLIGAGADNETKAEAAKFFGVSAVTALKAAEYETLTIDGGVGAGNVGLAGLTVTGETHINGGGSNSINFHNMDFRGAVYVNSPDTKPRLHIGGPDSAVAKVVLESASTVSAAADAPSITEVAVNTTENVVLGAPVDRLQTVNAAQITLIANAEPAEIIVETAENETPSITLTLRDEFVAAFLAKYPLIDAEEFLSDISSIFQVATVDGSPVPAEDIAIERSDTDAASYSLAADKILIESGEYVIPLAAQTSVDTKIAWLQSEVARRIAHGTEAEVSYNGRTYSVALTNGAAADSAALTVSEAKTETAFSYRLDLIEDSQPVLSQGMTSNILILGETAGLWDIINLEDGTNITNDVTLSSSDPWVVDVNDSDFSISVPIPPYSSRDYTKWLMATGPGTATITITGADGERSESFTITVLGPVEDVGRVAAHAAPASGALKLAVGGGYDYTTVKFTDQYGDPFAQWDQIFYGDYYDSPSVNGGTFTVEKTVDGVSAPVATVDTVTVNAGGELMLKIQAADLTTTEDLSFYAYEWYSASTFSEAGKIRLDIGGDGSMDPAESRFVAADADARDFTVDQNAFAFTKRTIHLRLMKYTSGGYAIGPFTEAEYAGFNLYAMPEGTFSLSTNREGFIQQPSEGWVYPDTPFVFSGADNDIINVTVQIPDDYADFKTGAVQLQARVKGSGDEPAMVTQNINVVNTAAKITAVAYADIDEMSGGVHTLAELLSFGDIITDRAMGDGVLRAEVMYFWDDSDDNYVALYDYVSLYYQNAAGTTGQEVGRILTNAGGWDIVYFDGGPTDDPADIEIYVDDSALVTNKTIQFAVKGYGSNKNMAVKSIRILKP
ncbi:MAG: cell wall-binding repeat-containing protein [Gracilibacteraceae bacterium]|jgi:putative cell wall-binding protein|nr:cell wall-binding repeat-containing protein [Gracilibacteraceae bacterium]